MPIDMTCECGQRLRFHEGLAGRQFKCKNCGKVGVVRGEPTSCLSASGSDAAILHVLYPGKFFWWDVTVEVLLDGQPVGTGLLKKGIKLRIPTKVGSQPFTPRGSFLCKLIWTRRAFLAT